MLIIIQLVDDGAELKPDSKSNALSVTQQPESCRSPQGAGKMRGSGGSGNPGGFLKQQGMEIVLELQYLKAFI